MVSMRRLQELFKILNCSTQQQQATIIEVEIPEAQKSQESLNSMTSGVPKSADLSQPPVQNSSGFGSQQYQHRKTMCQSPQQINFRNSDRVIISQAPNTNTNQKNNHYISRPTSKNSTNTNYYYGYNNKNEITTKSNSNRKPVAQHLKSNDNSQCTSSSNRQSNRNLSAVNEERALKILNRDVKTPPAKEGNKFSRYLPLPAINSCGDAVNETAVSPDSYHDKAAGFSLKNPNYRNKNDSEFAPEVRSTSKDSRPKFHNHKLTRQLTYKVLNPLYVRSPLDLQPANFKKLQNQVNKRSKTIVIKSHQQRRSRSNETQSNPIEKFSREVHSKRLKVTKQLLEAAEKVKEGKTIDSAFWVQF